MESQDQSTPVVETPPTFPVVINEQLAVEEVRLWLDAKKIKPSSRMAAMPNIAIMVEAFMYGNLTLNHDTWTIKHLLNFPILDTTGQPYKTELEYKYRITAKDMSAALLSANDTSDIGNTTACGAALTDLPATVIGKLDTSDLRILTAVSVFF